MVKLESDYKAAMRDAILEAGGYATRIEDQYRVGFPDFVLSMPDTGIVIAEAKRFDANIFRPSPRQYIEMCRIEDGGGLTVLIGVRKDKHYLSRLVRDDILRGTVDRRDCVEQGDDETFPEVFQRWFKETKNDERQ